MKNTTEVCLAAGGVKPPKSIIRLCHHGFAPANIVTAPQAALVASRKMEPAWEKTAGLKFQLGSYKDANGQFRPCYSLTKDTLFF